MRFLPLFFCAAVAQWQIGPFQRPEGAQPVIAPNPGVAWESLHTFNPAAIVRNGKVYVLYRAEDNTGEMKIGLHTSRIGLAESADGIHFTRRPEPVLGPGDDSEHDRESPGGCEDPRIVEAEDGAYVLTYTQWNRKKTDVGIATSRDLVHWTKHGPMFASEASYKSAAIVTHLDHGRLIAARINGKYWMYWGEVTVRLATSPDLIHWTPVEGAVLAKRPGHFDSSFPEVGPPPVLTDRGIVVLYNGRNAETRAYAVGEALFAADDPDKLLERTGDPVFQPELPWEKTGQYAAGTTFAEGLIWFRDRWFLYYGCADSFVGVAFTRGAYF
jgi:beta-1,2-mannosidase